MEKTQNFTEGEIFLPLIRFALPVLLALFLQAMYGAVDLLIVGQFGGICVRLPVSWAMSKIAPVSLFRIGLATPIFTVVQIILCALFFMLTRKRIYED